MTTKATTKEALEPKLTMTVDELFALHPLPWSHHLLLIKDANGRQVIHTGGLYDDRGRLHEGSYLSGLNALLVELVNSRVSAPIAPVVNENQPCPDPRCNDHLGASPMPQCVTAVYWSEEVLVVADALRELSGRFNGIDCGSCKVCHRHRLYDTRGNVGPCSNPECLSHRISQILDRYEPAPPEVLERIRKRCEAAIRNRDVAPASTVESDDDDQPAHDGFHCEQCETTFFTEPHATEDGYWLCGPCWKGLQSELKAHSCTRAFPCRYRDARQCARDTMLGSECPKVCECACHAPASPAALRDEAEEFARQVVGTVFDNTVASPETLKQTVIERIADSVTPPSTLARKAAEEIQDWNERGETQGSHDADVAFIQAIIERCLSADGETR